MFPKEYNTYYEPFIGGGSILYSAKPQKAVCGDICSPLIDLWNCIKNEPDKLIDAYRFRWTRLQEEGYEVYYEIRDNFNKRNNPKDLLFLSRTCVNGLIRFNSSGKFNNSLHHTRPGINPDRLAKIIKQWSDSIKTTEFVNADYRKTTQNAKENDLIYLDPPYFHTKGRYYGAIDFDEFISYLYELKNKSVKFILSFDGKRGNADFTVKFPDDIFKHKIYIPSGNSSFKKVMDKEKKPVLEALYTSW